MKVKNVKPVGRQKAYDLSVKDAEHYILENGVVTHNTGVMYSSNDVFIMGRQQKKEGTEIVGWNFVINVEKSRTVKEKSKIILETTYDGGFEKYSNILELALEYGIIQKPSQGWYVFVDTETGEFTSQKMRAKDITDEIYENILSNQGFLDFIEKKYKLSIGESDDQSI